MHILVVNDDGPPSTHSSPYVHSLVRGLQKNGHQVSVCLPHVQRSWIGKAHMIGQTIRPRYYRPPPAHAPPAGLARLADEPDNEGSIHTRPFRPASSAASDPPPEEWVLVDGTPASCVQIGLNHVFASRGPIDLVVSGPNYGRNTTAVFALSSGTLGGALEAATCRVKSIALSYAFFDRNHDRAIIAEASGHAVRIVEALARQWPADGSVDLYSVNVPLVAGVSAHKTVFAAILQNYWRSGGCFAEAEPGHGAESDDDEEERIREGAGGESAIAAATIAGVEADTDGEVAASTKTAEATTTTTTTTEKAAVTPTTTLTHRRFKWAPKFTDVYSSVDEAPPGNDGWAVREGYSSITPLKANFFQAATDLFETEFKLEDSRGVEASVSGLALSSQPDPIYALANYGDPFVQPLVLEALRSAVPPSRLHLLTAPPSSSAEDPVSLAQLLPVGKTPLVVQITPYEAIDFDYAAAHAGTTLINSYMIRKALIRKHFLAGTVDLWTAKRPGSVLRDHVQRAEAFEVDYAEFLDDALVEAFDLRASLERNAAAARAAEREWWILKPSMSDRGQGIRLFSTMEELQAIFDGWEEDFEEDFEEDDEEDEDGERSEANEGADEEQHERSEEKNEQQKDYIAASHLRHFVAQPYLARPLLLPGTGGRKFHVRTYVLCVGALQVYVFRDMLALFAAQPYAPPWETPDGGAEGIDLAAHLTNTCLQDELDKGRAVRRFWDLEEPEAPEELKDGVSSIKNAVFDQICRVTGELFEAAAVAAPIHFQPLPQAFEAFGLDFLVAADGTAWLLEANAFPDFRQTGTGLLAVVAQFWQDALRLAVGRMGAGDRGRPGAGATSSREADLGQMVLVKDLDLGRR